MWSDLNINSMNVRIQLAYTSTKDMTFPLHCSGWIQRVQCYNEGRLILTCVLNWSLSISPPRPPGPPSSGLHGLVVVVGGSCGVLVLLHGSLGSSHRRLLGCLLDVGVLPSPAGPLLLGLTQAAPRTTVEVVYLQKKLLFPKNPLSVEYVAWSMHPPCHVPVMRVAGKDSHVGD